MRLAELAERYGRDKSALVVEIDGAGKRRALTHAELADLVRARARQLTEAGVRAGQLIGIRAKNSVDWVSWDLAANEIGALVKAFADDTALDDPDAFVRRHGLALLIADGVPSGHDHVFAPEDGPAGRAADAPAIGDEDLHSLVYSSGTAGKLKGLNISVGGTEYVISRFIDAYRISAADRHLIFLPLSNYQQRLSVYCCLWAGADLVLAPYNRVFAALKAERPTFVIGPPVFYDATIQLYGKTGAGASLGEFLGGNVRFLITGMAPIRRETLDRFWAGGVPLLEAYGLTECGMIAWNTPDAYRVGTVGRLIDPQAMTFLPDGELLINRPAPLSLGYFQDAGEGDEVFLAGGSIATGDYGSLDADGYLTLIGRKKDVIALGSGRKVHPAEIEAAFAGIDRLAELVVVPTPQSNRLGAIVTPDDPADEDLRKAIRLRIEEVNQSLDSYRRIASVVFCDKPLRADPRFMTANLKLSRRLAADYFARQAAEGANG
ncbi:MAG TPA: AMP-binding protein [Actinocrinis sp.]|uniref:AMP-binding protein n=1 Tax=Actinocrinis sp. TaxID=1920516 RepID=UPI002DDC9D00|nr:AMP-binding protein [Actinocrinis sp.]HEV2344240.1 AMP-binding protein [Actinocrinis sp.]